MTAHYKVWIHVESIDEDADDYFDVTTPDSVGGRFGTEDAAVDFANKVIDAGNGLFQETL